MANIYVKDCADAETAQNWIVMADGRIALEPSESSKRQNFSPGC
jgi:hypothetical protein